MREVEAGLLDARSNSRHPDQWLDSAETVLAAVYHDEAAGRRELEISNRVRAAVARPSDKLQEQLGPAPAQGTSERSAWDRVAREVATDQIRSELAAREGVDPPAARTAAEERALQEQIDNVRQNAGLAPAQIEQGGKGQGIGR